MDGNPTNRAVNLVCCQFVERAKPANVGSITRNGEPRVDRFVPRGEQAAGTRLGRRAG